MRCCHMHHIPNNCCGEDKVMISGMNHHTGHFKFLPSGPSCSKPNLANPGLLKNFNCYFFTVNGGFFTRLRF